MRMAHSTAFVFAVAAQRPSDRTVHMRSIEWVRPGARDLGPHRYEEVVIMRTPTLTTGVGVVSALGLIASMSICSTPTVHAADPTANRAMVFAPRGELHDMASGAAEDTLRACLARIPRRASVGQRTLAEQSCAGEASTRKAIHLAPKF